jgi:hypothetical protein
VSRRTTITIIIMSSIIRQYRCSEVIIITVKAPPIKWCNQHMNSAIVVAYNNNKNGDDDYVYSIDSNMIAVLYYTIIM